MTETLGRQHFSMKFQRTMILRIGATKCLLLGARLLHQPQNKSLPNGMLNEKEAYMGPEIIIKALEIVNNGTLQIDFQNTETNEQWRCFAEPEKFFSMLGKAMQKHTDKYMEDFFKDKEQQNA